MKPSDTNFIKAILLTILGTLQEPGWAKPVIAVFSIFYATLFLCEKNKELYK